MQCIVLHCICIVFALYYIVFADVEEEKFDLREELHFMALQFECFPVNLSSGLKPV